MAEGQETLGTREKGTVPDEVSVSLVRRCYATLKDRWGEQAGLVSISAAVLDARARGMDGNAEVRLTGASYKDRDLGDWRMCVRQAGLLLRLWGSFRDATRWSLSVRAPDEPDGSLSEDDAIRFLETAEREWVATPEKPLGHVSTCAFTAAVAADRMGVSRIKIVYRRDGKTLETITERIDPVCRFLEACTRLADRISSIGAREASLEEMQSSGTKLTKLAISVPRDALAERAACKTADQAPTQAK
jgi:hypothetical protein